MVAEGIRKKALCICLSLALLTGWGGVGVAYADGIAGEGAHSPASAAVRERLADPVDLGYVPGEVVVVYEDGVTEADKRAAADLIGGNSASDEAEFDMGTVTTVDFNDELTVEQAADIIAADESVKYAVPNYLATLYDEPEVNLTPQSLVTKTDEHRSQQWHLDYVKAPAAWSLLSNRESVSRTKVAVIDTGASLDHPDLFNVINRPESIEVVWSDRLNYASWHAAPLRGDGYTNGGSAIDEHSGHGTHVSGIIAAEADNGGVTGVASAPDTPRANALVDLVVIDAFSLLRPQEDGSLAASAELNDIVFALCYARDAGCSVVNMSLGFTGSNAELVRMFNELTAELTEENDMLIVAAAGNEGLNSPSVPAVCDEVMGVISVSDLSLPQTSDKTVNDHTWAVGNTTRSWFSNYGTWCDISAPGEAILSTVFYNGIQNAYGFMSGTSMACPVVAGVAAMVRSANPSIPAKQVRSVLRDTATDLGQPVEAASGVINAEAAVARALEWSAPPLAEDGAGNRNDAPTGSGAQAGASQPTQTMMKGSWKHDGAGWWYQDARGGYPSSCWCQIDGKWYHFNRSGYMETGWQKIGSSWYYLNPSGAMATGWKKVGGSWYYLRSSGAMAVGWQRVDGAWYYLGGSGVMKTGWLKTGGSWYYLNSSGAMATGWKKVGGSWYYLRSSGAMATGWQKVDGAWYYLNGSGVMAANRWVGNYYVTGSGAMATSTWIGSYYVNAEGKWTRTR